MRIIAMALLALTVAGADVAVAAEPALKTPKRKLDSALVCPDRVTPAGRQPVLFVTGTGSRGAEGYSLVQEPLRRLRRPVCYVEFPAYMTADVQVSAEYLVHSIRVLSRRAGKPIAIVGLSQGGLLGRWALTYWPSLRRKVTDVVALAGTQHGTMALTLIGDACSPYAGCSPAVFQQAAGSNLLRALNAGRDETPGPTAWTTVRSAVDEVVQPQTGEAPTSALQGATNILIQDVCPGRLTSHVGTAVDSVAVAAIADALTHRGAARRDRLAAGVCSNPFGPGIDPQLFGVILEQAAPLLAQRLRSVSHVLREPRVRAYARTRD
jgi:pimeloyl-ACP methyl ester carboxylesterase